MPFNKSAIGVLEVMCWLVITKNTTNNNTVLRVYKFTFYVLLLKKNKMKTIILIWILCMYVNMGITQNSEYGKQVVKLGLPTNTKAYEEAEAEWTRKYAYSVMIGTSKLSASNGMSGFRIKDDDIRIVGFLHRYSKIEYDQIYVETKRDGIVLDSQILKGRSINASWKDFYIKLKEVVFSDQYLVSVYSYPDKIFLGKKKFYIKKEI